MTEPIQEQRTLSLKFLRSTALIPVRVDYGHKRPPGDWNPKMIEGADHSVTMKDLESGDYNIGALFAGKWVDIDIDNENPYLMSALDFFLPYSNYIWGRPSKPRSHRAYALFEDFDRTKYSSILRYIKGLDKGVLSEDSLSLEVRGGKAESGMFTVLPGSWREDVKELVAWDGSTDMSTSAPYVDVNVLLKAVRLAVAAAIVAPYWVAGARNDMSLALAGLLYRIKVSALASYGVAAEEDVEDGTFILTEADAIALLRGIMHVAGDNHGDEFTREQNLKNTWHKMETESGAKATGGKALATMIGEYGEKVVKGLYRVLSDNSAAEEIEHYMDKFVIWYGPGVLIDLDMVRAGVRKPYMLKQQAEVSLGGRKINIGGKNVPLSNMLFNTSLVQRVTGLTFDPTTTEIIVDAPEGKAVNRWRGFATEPFDGKVTDADVKPFLDYMDSVVASGDKEASSWALDWLSDILQDPGDKPGTAFVLVGEQGAGKTFLGEAIMRKIIGAAHSGQTNKIDSLVNHFNATAESKIFMLCDESSHSGSRMAADALKSIISDSTIQIEPKGIDPYMMPNHMRLMFTSNREATAVFIDGTAYERRYTVMQVSPVHAKDTAWWGDFRAWTDENLPKIMRYLLDRKYDKATVRRPYETTAKRLIQSGGLEPELAFVLERMDADFIISEGSHEHYFDAYNSHSLTAKDKDTDSIKRDTWPDVVRIGALDDDYRKWVRGRGHAVWGNKTAVKLAHVLGVARGVFQQRVSYFDEKTKKHVDARPRFYALPPKAEIHARLRELYGDIVDDLQVDIQDNGPAQPADTEERF